MTTTIPAMELRDVSKRFDGFYLDHVSLTLPQGCIMGFIGENGAGKSTTIKLLLDLIKRDEGSIRLLGQTENSKGLREHLGVVMDETSFPENLSAKDVQSVMKNVYRTWNRTTYQAYLKRFGLPETKPVKDYSRGMKMKLSIAVALSHDAKLLILDEATSGLDPIVRDEILDVFLEFIQEEDHSIFLSSHILSDLEKICDYITFLHKGKVIFTEPKDELLDKYCIVKCSEQEFRALPSGRVRGYRKNSFGVEALLEKRDVPSGLVKDPAQMEDIMLFYVKGEAS